MTKTKKLGIVLGVLAGCIAALAAVYCVLRFGFSIDVLDRSGWQIRNGVYCYLDYFGRPQTQWQEIDGKQYYFEPENGTMVTGWYTVDDEKYYFGEDGVRAAGWKQIDGGKYYFGKDGVVTAGWTDLDGKRMYFSQEGVLQTGWQTLEGKRYYFTDAGVMAPGWNEIDGVRYQFAEDGSVVTGWFEDASGRYFFSEDGTPHEGFLDWEQKRYYLKENGAVTTGWLTLGEDRYYFLPSGRMAIGEVEIDGISRFFTSTGKEVLLCNPWHAVPDDFEIDLVKIEGKKIDRAAQQPLQQMMNACRDAGLRCVINNSYRSRQWQQNRWDLRISQRMAEGMTEEQAAARTGRSLAIPGHSEHQTGLAVDIIGSQKMYTWLEENCWDYGFILRYPADRIDITGIIHEPWHFRYVGTELSKELQKLGLCMEEYMTWLTEQQKEIKD